MREDKLDRWGDIASLDQVKYDPTMQEIQERYQRESLRRLDERLEKLRAARA